MYIPQCVYSIQTLPGHVPNLGLLTVYLKMYTTQVLQLHLIGLHTHTHTPLNIHTHTPQHMALEIQVLACYATHTHTQTIEHTCTP